MSNNNDLHTFPIHSIMSLIIPFHHYLLLIDLKKMCEYQLIHLNTIYTNLEYKIWSIYNRVQNVQ